MYPDISLGSIVSSCPLTRRLLTGFQAIGRNYSVVIGLFNMNGSYAHNYHTSVIHKTLCTLFY